MFQITRKTFLARNLKRLQKLFPFEYDFFPKTWILPNEVNDLRAYAQKPITQNQSPVKKKNKKRNEAKTLEQKEREKERDEKEKEIDATLSSQIEVRQEMIIARSVNRQAKRLSTQPGDLGKKDSVPLTSSSEEESEEEEAPVKSPRKPHVKTKAPARTQFTMIVKPDCMSQGKGIFLTRNIDEIPP